MKVLAIFSLVPSAPVVLCSPKMILQHKPVSGIDITLFRRSHLREQAKTTAQVSLSPAVLPHEPGPAVSVVMSCWGNQCIHGGCQKHTPYLPPPLDRRRTIQAYPLQLLQIPTASGPHPTSWWHSPLRVGETVHDTFWAAFQDKPSSDLGPLAHSSMPFDAADLFEDLLSSARQHL